MKKLFVLFLLVALVPFTIGCGLFGDNEDTTAVPQPTKLTAKVTLPAAAAPSLRAAIAVRAAETFKNFVMVINGITLTAETEEQLANNDWVVTFGKVVSAEDLIKAQKGLVLVEVKPSASTAAISSVYLDTTKLAYNSAVVITVKSDMTVDTTNALVGTTSVTPVAVSNIATVSSFTAGKGTQPEFTAVLSENIFADFPAQATLPANTTFKVEVRKAGGAYVEATAANFNNYSYNTTTKTLKANLTGKTLTIGAKYEIFIRSITTATKSVPAANFDFTATAQ